MHLAHVNVARAKAPLDSPVMAGFVAAIAEVNRMAEAAPGFVWRLKGEAAEAHLDTVFSDPLDVANVSVWERLDALRDYAYSGAHLDAMRRRREWFERPDGPHLALWWIEKGTTPTPEDARDHLAHLAAHGPTVHAFTFADPFEPVSALS